MAEIIGAERVTEIYGTWPAFHDAEVLRVRLDHDGAQGASLEADIHVFRMTSEVDAKGFFGQRDHYVVTLRFAGLTGLDLVGFEAQNVISWLDMEEATDPDEPAVAWHVRFGSSFGMGAEFRCAAVSVAGVEPFDAAQTRD